MSSAVIFTHHAKPLSFQQYHWEICKMHYVKRKDVFNT